MLKIYVLVVWFLYFSIYVDKDSAVINTQVSGLLSVVVQ